MAIYALRNVEAHSVSLHNHAYVSNVISPSAWIGMIGSILHDHGHSAFDGIKVIPIIHDIYSSGGRIRGGKGEFKGEATLSVVEIPDKSYAHVSFSLIFEIPDYQDIDSFVISEALKGKRLSGGTLFPQGHNAFDVNVYGSVAEALSSIDRGYAMTPVQSNDDESTEYLTISFGEYESLWKLMDLLSYSPSKDKSGWFIPCPIGYRLLENPSAAGVRKNSRSNKHPHAYCEPGIGIAELIYTNRLKRIKTPSMSDLGWSYDTSIDNVILFHNNYQQSLIQH